MIMNVLKCKLFPKSSLFIQPLDPWPTLFLATRKPFSLSSCSSSPLIIPSFNSQLTSIKSLIKSRALGVCINHAKSPIWAVGSTINSTPCFQCYYSSYGPDKNDSDDSDGEEKIDYSGDDPDGSDYPKFVNHYSQKVELLKKDLSRVTQLDKLFKMVVDNLDYIGRFNAGIFISRLSHLTDPREKSSRKLTQNQIDFLTKLVLVNINILPDANLLSLVAIILSQKIPDDDKLTVTTLQEIRRRLKDLGIQHLVWLWKQSGFKIKSQSRSREWAKLREEIINVVERRVDNFSYDFQNVTEISQLARILLSKSSSLPYLNRLIKNMTIFTESIDYGLAWALLIQLTPSHRRFEKIDSKDITAIYSKCYQVIGNKLFENNYQMDNYVRDYFFQRVKESPSDVRLTFDKDFYKSLVKVVKTNQKQLGLEGLVKSLTFFGCNRYYPTELLAIICDRIRHHSSEYLLDSSVRPNTLCKIFSESRYFESRPKQWESFSEILLDPVKITILTQEEKFRLLSYLLIMGDTIHLNKFCPEFDDLCESARMNRHFWRAFHHIYAALSKPGMSIPIEGKLIKQSLEKYAKKGRRTFHFVDRSLPETEFDEILASVLGGKSYFVRKAWTSSSLLLDYVIAWDRKGEKVKFDTSRGKNNVALIDDLLQGVENYFIVVVFPTEESHYCFEPTIMRGQFTFKLDMIKQHGFTPLIVDRRTWKDLATQQKVSMVREAIENAKTNYIKPQSDRP